MDCIYYILGKEKYNMKRVVRSSLVLSLVFVMVLTSGLVVNHLSLIDIQFNKRYFIYAQARIVKILWSDLWV